MTNGEIGSKREILSGKISCIASDLIEYAPIFEKFGPTELVNLSHKRLVVRQKSHMSSRITRLSDRW